MWAGEAFWFDSRSAIGWAESGSEGQIQNGIRFITAAAFTGSRRPPAALGDSSS